MSGTTVLRMPIAALLLAAANPSHADSWMPPQPQTYLSPNGQVRLRVIPRSITSPLDYFKDKTKNREPAGQKHDRKQKTARGVLERVAADGKWQRIWDHPLVNDVSPVGAVVANDGRIVTFDNWHSMGYGPDAVVVYDGGGQKIRALSLADILPHDYVTALPHTISSIWWHGRPRVSEDGQNLILPVVIPEDEPDLSRDGNHAEIAIRLTDGAVIEPQSAAWADALAQARKVAAHKRAQDEEIRKFFTEPLRGPHPPTEPGWHQYLREAFYRWTPARSRIWTQAVRSSEPRCCARRTRPIMPRRRNGCAKRCWRSAIPIMLWRSHRLHRPNIC